MLHFPELHHFPVTFGDGRSEAAFTRLEARGQRLSAPQGREPRASETRPGARRKMIEEAATWAAPRTGKAGSAD